MARKLKDSVVVITGAASGIGRATALEFARNGATVVLAARRAQALDEVARECQILGGRALAVTTDVRDEEAVKRLARQAIENFGRIDVWVNDAAVTLFARFEEAPSDVYRQVLETNLFGCIHGIRAVLPYFREQGSGTLINLSSVVSEMPQPYTSAYVCSKWAIRALSECLRMELNLDDARNIHVCTVMPASIDTPLFQQAANYTGRAAKALPPVYPPEKVAAAIVDLAEDPRREVIVGGAGRAMMWFRRLSPALFERVMARQIDREHLSDQPEDPTPGNLFEPMPQYASVTGGWRSNGSSSAGNWALLGLAVAVPALAYWANRNATKSRSWKSALVRALT